MKKLLIILTFLISLFSCSENKKVENSGIVLAKNGYDELDSVQFECVGCKENLSIELFNKVIEECTEISKQSLNNPLSFVPKKVNIVVIKETDKRWVNGGKITNLFTVISDYKCYGKNAYGTELETNILKSFNIHNKKIVDLKDDIKLEDVNIERVGDLGLVNRNINILLDDDWIEIQPIISDDDISLVSRSSISCVKDAFLIISTENDYISMVNINDFNCDGESSYYYLNDDDIKKLKNEKIKEIRLNVDDEQIIVNVPNNQQDYFIQILNQM